jgi:endoglucanase
VEVSAVSANPSLYGLTSMQVFDKTVEALTNAGLGVVLNNHISDAMWCCSTTDGNGLWHTTNYPEDMWLEAVASMSERYVDNLLVIGNDLRNEIREDFNDGLIASWGTGNQATDWMLAAQNCANEVLQRAPNQLMIIEGLNFANNLEPVKKNPIELNVPDKLVYSFHLYPWQTHVTSFDNWEDFSAGIYKKFGFILEENNVYTAPLFVGEFGQAHHDNYWDFLMRWLTENPQVGWAQWSWNGYKTTPDTNESYGIMKSDMCTVRHEWLLSDLSAIMDAPSPQTNIFEFDTLL